MATRKRGKRAKVIGGAFPKAHASVDSMRDLYLNEQKKKALGRLFEEESRQQPAKVVRIKVHGQ